MIAFKKRLSKTNENLITIIKREAIYWEKFNVYMMDIGFISIKSSYKLISKLKI